MKRIRVIPILLIQNGKLVKTIQFNKPTYIGDPLNAIKIFNDKEVDEIIVLDISASLQKKSPDFNFIKQFASECFMPLGYGGGIKTLEDAKKVFASGAEKVILNTALIDNPELITEIANIYGSQAVVVSIDIKKNIFGKYQIFTNSGTKKIKINLINWIKDIESLGAGEIIVNSINNDGKMQGFDLELIKLVSQATKLPVVACGGASSLEDFKNAISYGKASAVGAGSVFMFNGKLKGVLISYPSQNDLKEQIYTKI
jgi:imidazole glycerol-phosphate synthase subunit HisF